ncbi:MAG: nitrogen fixation protein FixF [Pseudomonadota bacterium]
MTRFAVINTDNTAPLIAALGNACDALTTSGTKDEKVDASLAHIAERNATRRAIRYPWLFGNTVVKAIYTSIYGRKIRRQYAALYEQLAIDTSRTALVFNGFLAPNALVDHAAQALGMKRLYLENGFFPGTLQADRAGINGLSTLPRNPAFYDALSDAEAGADWPEDFEVRKSKLQAKGPNRTLPDRFIFVPFQVPSDMQILALSPWIQNMEALHNEVRDLAAAFPEKHFVIKEHPSFPRSVQDHVIKMPNIHFANHAVTRELLEACDGVITVNSTVGLEALVLGKKLITLGNAHYAINGLVCQADNSSDLHQAFSGLDSWEPNIKRRERFIRFVYNRFLIPGDRKAPCANTITALKARTANNDVYSKLISEASHATPSD